VVVDANKSFLYNLVNEKTDEIDPGMALTPFPSSILDEMRFEPPINHESSSLFTRPVFFNLFQVAEPLKDF